jgi:hypothetical protein
MSDPSGAFSWPWFVAVAASLWTAVYLIQRLGGPPCRRLWRAAHASAWAPMVGYVTATERLRQAFAERPAFIFCCLAWVFISYAALLTLWLVWESEIAPLLEQRRDPNMLAERAIAARSRALVRRRLAWEKRLAAWRRESPAPAGVLYIRRGRRSARSGGTVATM